MGLTDAQRKLIDCVVDNNLLEARKWALVSLDEDKTQKNHRFVERNLSILKTLEESNDIKIPSRLQGFLILDDVEATFQEDRYYLSEREAGIFNQVEKMQKVSNKLLESGVNYTNSSLFYGGSGTGKTLFGRYIAYKMALPFCYLNFANIIDSHMGQTSRNLNAVFEFIKTFPCVFMLDELDCISISRSGSGGSDGTGGELARITISLMQFLDGLDGRTILLGATNRIDRIDEAILRRFAIKHEVKQFDEAERKEMVEKFLKATQFKLPEQILERIIGESSKQSETVDAIVRAIADILMEEMFK